MIGFRERMQTNASDFPQMSDDVLKVFRKVHECN